MCQTTENSIFGIIVIMRLVFIFINLLTSGWKPRSLECLLKWLLLKIFACFQFKSKSFSLLEGKEGETASRVEALKHEYLMVAFKPDS